VVPAATGPRRNGLDLAIDDAMLRELVSKQSVRDGESLTFVRQRLRIDPRAQALVALVRHSLHKGIEPLEAESLVLVLAQRAVGSRTSHAAGASFGQRRLVDRVKLAIAGDLARRWTLAEVAAEVGGSPVYLTQVFQRVEGVPLYRYQLRLRLARALDLIGQYDAQSQAAHVLIVMIVVSSEHPKSGCAENITATTGALSDSLATYRTSAERPKRGR
jgi:AraC family transcriptional regulator